MRSNSVSLIGLDSHSSFHTDFQRHVNNQGYFQWSSRSLGDDFQAAWVPVWDCCCCSVTKLCLALCNPMGCSTPGSSVFHYLREFAQTHAYWVGDVRHPSHPLQWLHGNSWRSKERMQMRDFIHCKIFPQCYLSFLCRSSPKCLPMLSGPCLSPESITFSTAGIILSNSGRPHRQCSHWRPRPVLLTLHLASRGTCLGAEPRIWHPWSCPEASEDAAC